MNLLNCREVSEIKEYSHQHWFPTDPGGWHSRPDKDILMDSVNEARNVLAIELAIAPNQVSKSEGNNYRTINSDNDVC